DSRNRREYELFPLPPLRRAYRHFRPWRRAPRSREARRSVPRRSAARSCDSRDLGRRHAHRRLGAAKQIRRDFPRHGGASCQPARRRTPRPAENRRGIADAESPARLFRGRVARESAMKFLGVHPGPLMYTKVFLRLEPLGLELVAASARAAGHQVQLLDLQVEDHPAYHAMVARWRPDVIAFSCNYLANVPEI